MHIIQILKTKIVIINSLSFQNFTLRIDNFRKSVICYVKVNDFISISFRGEYRVNKKVKRRLLTMAAHLNLQTIALWFNLGGHVIIRISLNVLLAQEKMDL